MYQIQLKFKGQNKKITVAKSLQTAELQKLIAQCFSINEKVIGVTNKSGCFLELNEFNKLIPTSTKEKFALVTAKDINQDSMSFGTVLVTQLRSTTNDLGRMNLFRIKNPQSRLSTCRLLFRHGVLGPLRIWSSLRSCAWQTTRSLWLLHIQKWNQSTQSTIITSTPTTTRTHLSSTVDMERYASSMWVIGSIPILR